MHYLPPLDPRSEEFLELFRSFLTSKDERKTILELSEDDAKVFIEIIDRVCSSRIPSGAGSLILSLGTKAFRAARLDNHLRTIALSILRRLGGRTGLLPESYQLSEKFYPSEMAHASGGFSDVRKGVFKGKDVAVKSLRISESDDRTKIRKVVNHATTSHPGSLTLRAAFLQGGCDVEELGPPKRPRPHWGRRHPRVWEVLYGLRMDGQRHHHRVRPEERRQSSEAGGPQSRGLLSSFTEPLPARRRR